MMKIALMWLFRPELQLLYDQWRRLWENLSVLCCNSLKAKTLYCIFRRCVFHVCFVFQTSETSKRSFFPWTEWNPDDSVETSTDAGNGSPASFWFILNCTVVLIQESQSFSMNHLQCFLNSNSKTSVFEGESENVRMSGNCEQLFRIS